MKNILEKGQSLFEVVVAIAISALIITAIVSLATNSIQNSSYSRDKTLAANYASETMEWLRGQRDAGSADFLTHILTPSWCFQTLAWISPGQCPGSEFITGTKFIRQGNFTVSSVSNRNLIEAEIVISWQDAKGIHQVTSSTNFSIK